MPRHRKGRVPTLTALRRVDKAARSAGFVAAQIQAAVTATTAKVRWPAAAAKLRWAAATAKVRWPAGTIKLRWAAATAKVRWQAATAKLRWPAATATLDPAAAAAATPVEAASLSSATGAVEMAAVTVRANVDRAAVTVLEKKDPASAAIVGVDPDADTVRLPRFIARGKKPRKRRRLPQPPRLLRNGARIVFVSPWLAVGAGLVIAAALVIASPHMELNNFDNLPCVKACAAAPPSHAPHHAPRQLTHHASLDPKAAKHSRLERLVRRTKFNYSVAWQHGDQFAVMIILSSQRQLHHWRLAFTMPGTTGLTVDNASFRPNTRGDGGFATPAGTDRLGAQGDYGDAVAQHWGPHPTDGNMIVFFVTGTGTFTKLTHSRFDGIHCWFRPLHFPDRTPR